MNTHATAEGGGIRAARRDAGLSRQKLASLADCSVSYLQLLEGGFTPADSSVIPRIMRVLNEKRPGGNQVALKTASARDGRHAPE